MSSETFEQQTRYLFLACHCFYISPPPLPTTTHWHLLRISSSFRPPLSCVSISKPPFSTQFFFLVFIYIYNQILSCPYHQPLDCYHIIHIIPTTQYFRFFFFCFFLHLFVFTCIYNVYIFIYLSFQSIIFLPSPPSPTLLLPPLASKKSCIPAIRSSFSTAHNVLYVSTTSTRR